jgi:hypothetical protein
MAFGFGMSNLFDICFIWALVLGSIHGFGLALHIAGIYHFGDFYFDIQIRHLHEEAIVGFKGTLLGLSCTNCRSSDRNVQTNRTSLGDIQFPAKIETRQVLEVQ